MVNSTVPVGLARRTGVGVGTGVAVGLGVGVGGTGVGVGVGLGAHAITSDRMINNVVLIQKTLFMLLPPL
jgi:hypothetical protein